MRFVKGLSKDYVFLSGTVHGPKFIQDYGKLSNEGLIEILCRRWSTDDELLKKYIIEKIAKRLDVKLRKNPLTNEQLDKQVDKIMAKSSKRLEKFLRDISGGKNDIGTTNGKKGP